MRNWLADRAAGHGIAPGARSATDAGESESETAGAEAALVEPLMRWAEPAEGEARTADQDAVALVAAAVGFHRREDKPYWWSHFARLSADLEELDSDRETMVVREARIIEDWHKPPRKQNQRRTLELTGDMPAGSELEREKNATLLYDAPSPQGLASSGEPGSRGWRAAEIDREATTTDDSGRTVLRVVEVLPRGLIPTTICP